MEDIRKISDDNKIQANSLPELLAGIKLAHMALKRKLRYEGVRYDPGHLINQIIADALTITREELAARALRGKAVLEALSKRPESDDGLNQSMADEMGIPSVPDVKVHRGLPGSKLPRREG